MTILIRTESKHTLVQIHENFDAKLMAQARSIFEEIIQHADRNVILDLSQVEVLDSSGIGAIVFLFKRLYIKGIKLELKEMQEHPFRLIEQLHINEIITVSKKKLSISYDNQTNPLRYQPKRR